MNRSRTILLAFLPVLLVATVLFRPDCSTYVRSGAAVPAAGPPDKIRADVVEALAREDWVRAIITLQEPAATHRQPLDRRVLVWDVARSQQRVLNSLGPMDFRLIYRYEGIAGLAGFISSRALSKLSAHPDVTAVTRDGMGTGSLAESVPMINADDVHALGITGTGVVVAVLDSGADTDHPDLAGDIVVQECFLSSGGCPPGGGTRSSGPGAAEDDHGHGTNVTGIITSAGVLAPTGVAPDAEIAAYKVLNSSNVGFFSDWDAALSDIIANHPEVSVVNMSLVSWGTYTGTCDAFQPTTTSAINTLRAGGTLTFVSSGNNRVKNGMTYPACISTAVSVGAVYDQTLPSSTFFNCTDTPANQDQVTCWSNSDATLDLLAPGAFTTSTGIGGGISVFGGTSQASPHAAGVAALLLDDRPSLTPDEIESLLESTGVLRTDPANGRVTARVDALAAVNSTPIPSPTPTVTPTPGPDTDNDGCADVEEQAGAQVPKPGATGAYDPTAWYDFFDVPVPSKPDMTPNGPRNRAIDISDVIAVLFYSGAQAGGPANGNGVAYDIVKGSCDWNGDTVPDKEGLCYDRTPGPLPSPPNDAGPPNGAIDMSDVIAALAQAGLDCSGPP